MEKISHVAIGNARRALGLKAFEAAKQLGLSASYYSEIEKGHKPIPPHLVAKFGEVLGIHAKNFAGDGQHVAEDVPAYGGKPLQLAGPADIPVPGTVSLVQLSGAMMQVLSRIAQIDDDRWRKEALVIVQPVQTVINAALNPDASPPD